MGDGRPTFGTGTQGERRVTSLPHLLETALLLTVAYLVGCLLGSGLRRLAQGADRAPISAPAMPAGGATPRLALASPAAPLLALPPPPTLVVLPLKPMQPAILPEISEPAQSVEPPMARMDEALRTPRRAVATVIALPRRDALLEAGEIADIGRPPGLDAPRNGSPDDLQKIKGIGPRLATALNTLGIFHFEQIARWNEMNLVWIEAQPHLRGRVVRDKWVEQAASLAGIVLAGRDADQRSSSKPASGSARLP